jgi:dihydrofolate synthase/folylpolyglutamate synthase
MPLKSLGDWLKYIETLRPNEEDFSLDRIRPVYEELVKNKFAESVVIVGGTNGKGTTVEYLQELAKSQGLRVGSYTSPHLFNFNERIRLNGNPVTDSQIIEAFKQIEQKRGSTHLTYFDFATLGAFIIFSEVQLDMAILEIGIGGRFDPVNLVEPDLSILTNVDLDHQNWLGTTTEEIGKEKAAIFRKNKPAILGQKNLPASVHEEAKRLGASVVELGVDFKIEHKKTGWTYLLNNGKNQSIVDNLKEDNLSIEAAACALTAFFLLKDTPSPGLQEIINSTNLKGRCDLINKKFLLDVSHNPASVLQLSKYIESNYRPDQKISAIFGVMQDKEVTNMVRLIKKHVTKWYATSPNIERSLSVENLTEVLSEIVTEEVVPMKTIKEAINIALLGAEDELVLIFGSFYTISEAFKIIKKLES